MSLFISVFVYSSILILQHPIIDHSTNTQHQENLATPATLQHPVSRTKFPSALLVYPKELYLPALPWPSSLSFTRKTPIQMTSKSPAKTSTLVNFLVFRGLMTLSLKRYFFLYYLGVNNESNMEYGW